MIKRFDKRGEGPSYSMVLVVIAIAVLLLVLFGIFGISNAVEKGLTTFGVSMIDEKVTACNLHAMQSLKDSFCGYRYLEKNTYMNCMYPEVYNRLLEGDLTAGQINAIGCSQKPIEFCVAVCKGEEKEIKFSEVMTVNGETCESLGIDEEACNAMKTQSE